MPPLTKNSSLGFNVTNNPTGLTFGNDRFWNVTYGVLYFSKYTTDGTADGTISHSSQYATGVVFHNDMLYVLNSSSAPTVEPQHQTCLLYTSPSPRDRQKTRMPSSA